MGRKLAGAAPRLPAPPLTTDAADVSLGGEEWSHTGAAGPGGGRLVQTTRPDGEPDTSPGVLK